MVVTRVPRRKIFAQTGLQFLPFNTLFQLIAMRRAEPKILDAAERLLLMPDFFHWLLSGSQVVEFTNATTTQCLDPGTGDWAGDLLSKFGDRHAVGQTPQRHRAQYRLGPD